MATDVLKELNDTNPLLLIKEARRSKIQIVLFDVAIYLICTLLGLMVVIFAG